MLLAALVVVTSVSQIIITSFVLLRDQNNLSNRLFFFMGMSALGWALTSYWSIVFLNDSFLINIVRLILFFVVVQNTLFCLFANTFPGNYCHLSRSFIKKYLIFSAVVAVLALTPITFSSVKVTDIAIAQAGPGISLFILHALISIILAFRSFIKKLHKAKGKLRGQLQILLVASVLTWVVVPITNFALTPLLKTTMFVEYAPVYTLLFASIIAYAIITQKLFDIRGVIARALAYLSTIVFLAAIYGFVVFGAAKYIFNLHIPIITQIWLSVATGFAAMIFPVLRRRFDRLTIRLFYRESYESQVLYDQLNRTLVASQTMDGIIMKSLSIIETHLKPEFALVGLKNGAEKERIFGTRKMKFDPADVAKARKITTHIHHKVIVADNLDDTVPKQAELKEVMGRNNLAVLVRLTHNVRLTEEGLGYLILGFRKSGNTYSQQDVEVLDTIANELVIAIQNALHVEEIQNFNETLQKRVDEATRRLRQTNKRLKLLDETKDDFISMASHQLRTPLTSVKGYISMVLEGDAGSINATQRKMLEQSFASSQRMVYLIADLLNVSRLRTGKFVIQPSEVDLAAVVEQEISQLTETAQSREVKLTYKKPKTFPTLMLDDTKTRQVIMNFIDNAIYYTPAGGEIKLELSSDSKVANLKVIDNGIGVAKSDQHHLFTKFFRASNARRARPDGTGLGLFMANKVVLAQGGHIIFSSAENKGSTFGFSFPLKPLEVKPLPPEKDTDKAA